MLFELYKVLKIVKNSELHSSLKGLGEIAEGINMRDMDSFVIEVPLMVKICMVPEAMIFSLVETVMMLFLVGRGMMYTFLS